MNLRTNFKIKVKKLKGRKILTRKVFTLRYNEKRNAFLTEITRNYLRRINFDDGITCDITVYYCSTRGKNEGVYNNQRDLLNALECFTEKDLLLEYWDGVLRPKIYRPGQVERGKNLHKFKKGIKSHSKKIVNVYSLKC